MHRKELTLKAEMEMLLRVISSKISHGSNPQDANNVTNYIEGYLHRLVEGTTNEILQYCESNEITLDEKSKVNIKRINPIK